MLLFCSQYFLPHLHLFVDIILLWSAQNLAFPGNCFPTIILFIIIILIVFPAFMDLMLALNSLCSQGQSWTSNLPASFRCRCTPPFLGSIALGMEAKAYGSPMKKGRIDLSLALHATCRHLALGLCTSSCDVVSSGEPEHTFADIISWLPGHLIFTRWKPASPSPLQVLLPP